MALILNRLDERLAAAIQSFWRSQERALRANEASVLRDNGKRGAVTSGRHLDSLRELIGEVVIENGLASASLLSRGRGVTVPGFFRATKDWDLIIVHEGLLVAAIELKSMGSSFGKNLNNRAEEVIGQAVDFMKAHERKVFRDSPKPFLGYCVVLADAPEVHTPVETSSPHFPVLPEFEHASYAERFRLLCEKMVNEELYSEAALILSEPEAGAARGENRALSATSSFRRLISGLAAHAARIAAL